MLDSAQKNYGVGYLGSCWIVRKYILEGGLSYDEIANILLSRSSKEQA